MLDNEIITHIKCTNLDPKISDELYRNIIGSIYYELDEIRNDSNQTESYDNFLKLITQLDWARKDKYNQFEE